MGKEKPSFSDATLFAAETFQYVAGKTKIGQRIVGRMTGSDEERYEQLLWLPPFRIKSTNVSSYVSLQGTPEAKGSARQWETVGLLLVPQNAMSELKKQADGRIQEAVAYRSSKAWHIGISATRNAILAQLNPSYTFRGESGDSYSGVAVRRGRSSTDFTPGIYDQDRQNFIGVDMQPRAIYPKMDELDEIGSNLRLV